MDTLYLYEIMRGDKCGYDTYSGMIVCATNEETARNMHPRLGWLPDMNKDDWYESRDGERDCERRYNIGYFSGWVKPSQLKDLTVTLLGTAKPELDKGVIMADYHAG